jgi:hypothetical protein
VQVLDQPPASSNKIPRAYSDGCNINITAKQRIFFKLDSNCKNDVILLAEVSANVINVQATQTQMCLTEKGHNFLFVNNEQSSGHVTLTLTLSGYQNKHKQHTQDGGKAKLLF